MERIVTSGQMKRLDQFTIQEMGVPSLVLMERAALAVTEELEKNFDTGRVLVVCGSGNNGGDGIAAARLLYLAGVRTEIFLAGKMESFTEETRIQWKIAEKYGVPIVKNPDPAEYTTIVDAIFGVGLSRNVEGHYEALLKKLDASGVPVLAVDVPSGIDASRGRVMGTALHARQTVTFACAKAGLLLYPGASYAGQVTVRDVGICPEGRTMRGSNLFSEDSKGSMFRITDEDYRWLPPRNPREIKAPLGKVLVVAGSRDMCGAAFFAAKASLLAGAGMVRIFTEEHNRTVLQQLLPEALLTTYREDEEEETLRRLLGQAVDWADVAAAGPGMGTGRAADRIVTALLADSGKPLVLDADGLNLLSRRKELLKQTSSACILTPHMGEMSRLTGLPGIRSGRGSGGVSGSVLRRLSGHLYPEGRAHGHKNSRGTGVSQHQRQQRHGHRRQRGCALRYRGRISGGGNRRKPGGTSGGGFPCQGWGSGGQSKGRGLPAGFRYPGRHTGGMENADKKLRK